MAQSHGLLGDSVQGGNPVRGIDVSRVVGRVTPQPLLPDKIPAISDSSDLGGYTLAGAKVGSVRRKRLSNMSLHFPVGIGDRPTDVLCFRIRPWVS